jgi:hypothetical protein
VRRSPPSTDVRDQLVIAAVCPPTSAVVAVSAAALLSTLLSLWQRRYGRGEEGVYLAPDLFESVAVSVAVKSPA